MTVKCQKCSTYWNVSVKAQISNYECPVCWSKRKRAKQRGVLKGPRGNKLRDNYTKYIGGKQ